MLAWLGPFLRSRCAPTDSRLTNTCRAQLGRGGGAERRVDPLAKSSSVWWIRTGDDLSTGWGGGCGCDENYQRCGLRYSGDDRSTSRPQIRSYKKLMEKHSIEMCSNINIRLYPPPASLPRSLSHSLSLLFLPQSVFLSRLLSFSVSIPLSRSLSVSLCLSHGLPL